MAARATRLCESDVFSMRQCLSRLHMLLRAANGEARAAVTSLAAKTAGNMRRLRAVLFIHTARCIVWMSAQSNTLNKRGFFVFTASVLPSLLAYLFCSASLSASTFSASTEMSPTQGGAMASPANERTAVLKRCDHPPALCRKKLGGCCESTRHVECPRMPIYVLRDINDDVWHVGILWGNTSRQHVHC